MAGKKAAAKKVPAKKTAVPANIAKGARVKDPKGKTGVVTSVTGQIAKVKHDDGTTDTHPLGALSPATRDK
jgi:hypothetical protein